MAKYSAVKATVNAYIKQNGRKEITGRILNAVLNATIDSLGKYFQFAGGALPTDDPGTPDQNVCYLAGEPGVYTNFGGITIENEEVALLFWDGEWTKQRILIGIREVNASVDNQVGTPSVDVSYSGGELVLTFHNLKGEHGDTGDPAGFGTIGADINGGVGTPGVSVETSGDNTAKNLMFHFTNLKGETGVNSVVATIDDTSGTPSCQVSLVGQQLTLAFSGLKGLKGDTGVSADYPITIYNGLDSDATDQALAAAQGKVLDGKVSQLGQDLYGRSGENQLPTSDWLDQTFGVNWGSNTDKIYFDSRNIVDAEHRIKQFKIYGNIAGTIRVYFVKKSDYSIVTYKEVNVSGSGLQTFDITLEDTYYENGEMYVGIWSSITWKSIGGNLGQFPNTKDLVISTGVVGSPNSRAWGYGIVIDETTDGDVDVINRQLDNLDESVSNLNNAIFETKILPSAEWIDGTFPVNGGGDAQYAFFDSRTLIPAGVVPERVRFKATAINNVSVYLIKASDYSILASETITPVIGINDLSLSFAQSLYNVPTYIGIGSADSPIAMRNSTLTGEISYTNRLTIATGEVVVGRTYIIALEVKYTSVKTGTISQDLDEAIAQGGNDIVLGPYDYEVKSPIVLASGMTIRGSFGKTRLILTDGCQTAITASNAEGIKISDLEIVGTCPNYSVEMNGIIAGTGYDLVATEADAIALNYMGSEKGIYLYYCENVVLENLRINHIDGSAIRVNHTGMNYTKGLNACNLFITNCYNGIYCENEHEFSQYTNWTITSCMIGVYVASGNLIFTAGHATRCRFAMMFVAGTNHAHGVVNGIEIKHNQVAGIFCNGVVYGEFFEGIYLSYSPLVIRDSTGVYFDDIMVGNMSIDVTGTTGVNKIGKLVKRNNGISMVNTDTLTILETVQLY